jgi:peptidoglycan/LPS O-acetylase OafA/YrhL
VRSDIQALRGLAVLLVLATHARLGLPAGYLGVDIFFVISGFLITGMVDRAVDEGRFSFGAFYFRRAKRLLPAAYMTFALTALVAPFVLSSSERHEFVAQTIGAVTFTANFVLFQQTNYFAGAADFKPLLHIWSLSIEEQYYVFLPALVFFTPRRWRVAGAAAILTISLTLCLWQVRLAPPDAFYLTPFRVWELAIGSLGALALDRMAAGAGSVTERGVRVLFWPSVAALFLVPAFPFDPIRHPGIDALIVCVATLVVILRRHPAFSASAPVKGVAFVGDFSYSLYLVHWPILAFVNSLYLGPNAPLPVRLACVALAMGLGYALYRFVEQPVRRAAWTPNRAVVGGTVAVSLVIAALPSILFTLNRDPRDFAHLRRPNFGLDRACEVPGAFTVQAACRTGDKPALLIWGDSFAEHIVPAIAASTKVAIEQATSSGCGPLLGVAPIFFGPPCLAFNESVIKYTADTPSIETVVLASRYGSYLSGAPLLEGTEKAYTTIEPNPEIAFRTLKATVDRLHALRKRVVLVAPPPGNMDFSLASCEERRLTGLPTIGAPERCEIDLAAFQRKHVAVFELLTRVSAATGAPVFDLAPFMCKDGRCPAVIGDLPLYRDDVHFSIEGSMLLGGRIGLAPKLIEMAR